MVDKMNVNGQNGGFDIRNLKGGIKRSDLKNQKLELIFDKLDKDGNKILTQDEIKKFVDEEKMKEMTIDGVLSKKEANKFVKQHG